MEGRAARNELDVLLGGAQLQRHRSGGKRANHVDQQAGREDHETVARHLGLQGHTEAYVHVGRRSSQPSDDAASATPDSAWMALRVEATRLTVCSW